MKRMRPQDRRDAILSSAVDVVQSCGFSSVTREQVAEAAGISKATINYHFKSMDEFRSDLMRYAVRTRCLLIIAQGLVVGDKIAKSAPDDVKQRALDSLVN